MQLKKARQILKSLADDTRLRIINLLSKKELTVSELCKILNKAQPNISKHLTRLRLTGLASDKRRGLNVYYRLLRSQDKAYNSLLNSITIGLAQLEIFKQDLAKLSKLKTDRK
ncbi:MAG: metalloregulator ArsR/SmtB family transcription factor [Candidatus Omnitrophica bacterium]|nr:metalloregulator ArsR/SmtB family transcription factor [Candidatus Omnitrophota bacterium]